LNQSAKYLISILLLACSVVRSQSLNAKAASKNETLPCLAYETNDRPKKIILLGGTAALTTGSLIYLNQAWYSQYNTGKFHFFDDSEEWFQMDKAGHVLTTFQTSHLMMESFKWAGFPKNQQLFIGGTLGFAYMTAIEIMDGYSNGWGFSWSDVGANAIGTGIAMAQKSVWEEQRINFKFSFHRSGIAKYKPELLGANTSEEILKDYNGQTYWLSVSPFCFIKSDKKLPKWLAISFGYGAEGMLGARYNNVLISNDEGEVRTFERYRQYYISFDVDFSKIKTRSKVLKAVFNSINILKFPFPALEFGAGRAKFHPLYF
jgi:hypothetical protein